MILDYYIKMCYFDIYSSAEESLSRRQKWKKRKDLCQSTVSRFVYLEPHTPKINEHLRWSTLQTTKIKYRREHEKTLPGTSWSPSLTQSVSRDPGDLMCPPLPAVCCSAGLPEDCPFGSTLWWDNGWVCLYIRQWSALYGRSGDLASESTEYKVQWWANGC